MRIVKFLLIDLLFIALTAFFFLFNYDNDPRANILLAISIGLAGSLFELVFLAIYIISTITDKYDKNIHALLFSAFFIYVNIISFLYLRDGEMVDLNFYVFEFLYSVFAILVYRRILDRVRA